MSKYSVRKPVTVLMGVLIVMVLGVFSLTKLSLSLFPEMNLPYIVVVTPYAGADAEKVVTEVTSVIESKVTSMNNFVEVSSTSRQHYSIVMVEFADGTNMDSVSVNLRETLDNITFPEGVTKPTIMAISPDMLPVLTVSLSVQYEELDDEQEFIKATEFIQNHVIDRFTTIEGVAEVSLTGAADIVLQVNLDQQKLATLGYTNEQVLSLIEEQNINKMVGVAVDSGEIRMLYLGNAITSLEEVKKLPLPLNVNGVNEVYLLEELAITDGIKYINENAESYSKVNGKQTITLSFQKQNGIAITDVTDAIETKLEQLVNEYDNVEYQIVMSQGEYINVAIGSVVENLIWGAVLAIVILFIFLRDVRPTLIVALAIPISVIATFMCMYFVGIDLNMLSMGGLALGIGMLVDNAIVVIENIFRLRKEGKSKTEAAIEGAKGVASAITSSTITTIIVFLPMLFMGGLISDMFMNLAYTIAFSLIASLVISLTMVPALGSKILKDGKVDSDKEEKKPSKLMNIYESAIKWSLNHKMIAFVTVIALFIISVALVSMKGFVLLPTTDEGSISATIVVDSSVDFKTMSDFTDKLTAKIKQLDNDIETVSASFGSSTGMMSLVMGSSNANSISLSVKLDAKHKKSTDSYVEKIMQVIDEFDYNSLNGLSKDLLLEIDVDSNATSMTSLLSSGISIKIKGYDLEKLEAVALKVTEITNSIEGTKKVNSGVNKSSDNVKIYVDKMAAAEVGLTEKDFIDSINLVFENTGLTSLATDDNLILNFNGVEYTLNIPSDAAIGGMTLSQVLGMFGTYENFLSNFLIFDKKMLKAISEYNESIYMFMPVFDNSMNIVGLKLTVNPMLFYNASTNTITQKMIPDVDEVALAEMAKGSLSNDVAEPIVEVRKTTALSSISTDGKYRYFSVTGQIDKDYNITKVSSKITSAVNDYLTSAEFDSYRDYVTVEFVGENEEIMSTVQDMLIALAVAVLLVYMVIAIQFQSLIQPLIIMGTLPLAFTGGLLFILIFGMEFSVVAIMGLIVLVGVAVNNGIVLIDYINQLVNNGMKVKDACVMAGKTRLRPILMTALTTIFGLIVMAIGLSNGSELLQPLAITTIGGLLYATILTLFIIPVIYCGMKRKKIKQEEYNEDSETLVGDLK